MANADDINAPAKNKFQAGFTLVELLVVIVVIAILAAISVTAYNGVQDRAATAALAADLNRGAKLLSLDRIQTGAFANELELVGQETGNSLRPSKGTTFLYTSETADDYCLSAVSDRQNVPDYYISSDSGAPTQGLCEGHVVPGEEEGDDGGSGESYNGKWRDRTDCNSNTGKRIDELCIPYHVLTWIESLGPNVSIDDAEREDGENWIEIENPDRELFFRNDWTLRKMVND